ncbi:unnamed protein product [Urochloa humidicola]
MGDCLLGRAATSFAQLASHLALSSPSPVVLLIFLFLSIGFLCDNGSRVGFCCGSLSVFLLSGTAGIQLEALDCCWFLVVVCSAPRPNPGNHSSSQEVQLYVPRAWFLLLFVASCL